MKEKETKYFYSWQELDGDIKKIAEWAKEQNFKNAYGIPRGGLVPAVMLSHRLKTSCKITFWLIFCNFG